MPRIKCKKYVSLMPCAEKEWEEEQKKTQGGAEVGGGRAECHRINLFFALPKC